MTASLSIKHVNYHKNRQPILTDVNLTVATGKIVALLGANGAGKTSLMRVIAGLAKNYRGEVAVAGKTELAQRKNALAFNENLQGFSKSEKLATILSFYAAVYPDFDEERFNQLQEFMDLDLNQRLGQLSRGTKAKLVIALTFSRQVSLYLLDEPFSGIDVMSRKKIINSILLWKGEDATILLSDHFVDEIAQVLDEVAIIKERTILCHVPADQIRERGETVSAYYEAQYDEDI
ncbi:MAG: ATP-binding cassette domain-containing protein [Lactobacillus sp.]